MAGGRKIDEQPKVHLGVGDRGCQCRAMAPTGIDLHDARTIVEWVLGISLEPAGPRNLETGHDFHLLEDGRRIGAMVVARSICPSSGPQACGPVRRLSWNAGGRRSWVVRLEALGRSGPDERMIVGLLAELERAGGTGFQRADQVRVAALRAAGVRLSPAERVLEDLAAFGVVEAEPYLGDDLPTVMNGASGPARTTAQAVNEAVEDAAWRPANRACFAGCGVGDRHLFVWLDPADLNAYAAMDADDVPSPPLQAPETTSLWVARRPPANNHDLLADRVWQTNAVGEWEDLGSVVRRRVLAPASAG